MVAWPPARAGEPAGRTACKSNWLSRPRSDPPPVLHVALHSHTPVNLQSANHLVAGECLLQDPPGKVACLGCRASPGTGAGPIRSCVRQKPTRWSFTSPLKRSPRANSRTNPTMARRAASFLRSDRSDRFVVEPPLSAGRRIGPPGRIHFPRTLQMQIHEDQVSRARLLSLPRMGDDNTTWRAERSTETGPESTDVRLNQSVPMVSDPTRKYQSGRRRDDQLTAMLGHTDSIDRKNGPAREQIPQRQRSVLSDARQWNASAFERDGRVQLPDRAFTVGDSCSKDGNRFRSPPGVSPA